MTASESTRESGQEGDAQSFELFSSPKRVAVGVVSLLAVSLPVGRFVEGPLGVHLHASGPEHPVVVGYVLSGLVGAIALLVVLVVLLVIIQAVQQAAPKVDV